MESLVRVRGHIVAELFGPDGQLKRRVEQHNLVTDVGDQYLAQLAFLGGAQWGTHAMKLGTAVTAAAKNGAGSFVAAGDYVAGSAHACDAATPKQGASANIIQYQHTWAAGEATANNINRVGIVNNTTNAGEADASNTMAMSVFAAAINKAAADTLQVTWNVTLLGS